MTESVTLSLVSGETMYQIRHCFDSDIFPSSVFQSLYTTQKFRVAFCTVITLLAILK
jgi:hypothetical protein